MLPDFGSEPKRVIIKKFLEIVVNKIMKELYRFMKGLVISHVEINSRHYLKP